MRRSLLVLFALLLVVGCGSSRRRSEKTTPTATIGKLVPGSPAGTAVFLGPVRRVRADGITIELAAKTNS